MDGGTSEESEARFAAYVEALGAVLGHADRQQPMHDYCLGLLMPIARKSVEPMAAVTAPAQSLPNTNHCSILSAIRRGPMQPCSTKACPRESGGARAGAAGDRAQRADRSLDHRRYGFSKKGQHSVGVTRQYCGQLGKQDNCQVAVSLSLANRDASLPVAYRLYLPEDWAKDQDLRRKAKVPAEIAFQTKPEIALEQITAARAAGLP
jgi:SRSO17 transposase